MRAYAGNDADQSIPKEIYDISHRRYISIADTYDTLISGDNTALTKLEDIPMTKYDEINVEGIEGKTKGEVIEAVILSGATYKDAERYWKENGARTASTGFRALFYEEIKANSMTREEVKAFCNGHGSKNDAKAWTHYAAISALVEAVRKAVTLDEVA